MDPGHSPSLLPGGVDVDPDHPPECRLGDSPDPEIGRTTSLGGSRFRVGQHEEIETRRDRLADLKPRLRGKSLLVLTR